MLEIPKINVKFGRESVLYVFRFFLLVLLPFAIGMWVLPHTQQMNGQVLQALDESKDNSTGFIYTFGRTVQDASLPQTVNAAFPLANYLGFFPFVTHEDPQLCFADQGSYIRAADGSQITPNFEWVIHLKNNGILRVAPYTSACAPLEGDYWQSTYAFTGGLKISRTELNGTGVFMPQLAVYPTIIMDYGLLQGLILIPVAYLLIWYPAAGILRKIKDGLTAQ